MSKTLIRMVHSQRLQLLEVVIGNKLYTSHRKVHGSSKSLSTNKQQLDKKAIQEINLEKLNDKTKKTYLDAIKVFINRDVHRRGHVEFIYSALKIMADFGVHKDLEVYKAIIDVLPKGKFLPQNSYQVAFMHYPKQQQCAIDVLEQMEDNGVMPDAEMEQMLLNVFGKYGHPLRKLWRMMYWMPKFRHLSPWPVPNPPPNDSFELAKLAIERICTVDVQTVIKIYESRAIPDATEDTWIISGQSPTQKRLLNDHKRTEPIYIEGPYRIWLRDKSVNYFILRANFKCATTILEDPDDVTNITVPLFNISLTKKNQVKNSVSVHEQEDGIILAVCATGTSSKDSLLSWIRHLEQDDNSALLNVPIVFTLKTAEKEVSVPEKQIAIPIY